MSTYSTLLFDFDHTLFDSEQSEAAAFEHALRTAGIDHPGQHLAAYQTINRALWAEVEQGKRQPESLRVTRFSRLVAALDLAADPEHLADAFVDGMGEHGALYPGAQHVLEQLSATSARLALITNGLTQVQDTRLDRLGIRQHFHTVVISEAVGVAKPSRAIFDHTFAQLGEPPRSEAVMIGDSLTSDIQGGQRYGLATCWFNPQGKPADPVDPATHEIRSLQEVLQLRRSSTP